MRFWSTWSVVVAQIALNAVAQPVGRYTYKAPDGQLNISYDITLFKQAFFRFQIFGLGITTSLYPLTRQTWSTFAFDLGDKYMIPQGWYDAISPRLVITAQHGALTTLRFTSFDTLFVTLGGRRLNLVREAFPMQEGTFLSDRTTFRNFRVSYGVGANGRLAIWVGCDDSWLPVPLLYLVQNDNSLRFRSYDVTPSSEEIRSQVRRACPSYRVRPGDFSNVVFTSSRSLYITLEGRSLQLINPEPLSGDP
ncbi:hypothetical protein FOL47_002340 [Perkinsus chesapeaki]|uniref:Uncharacterized protein n=1 Tax=Perkinsus chesapeaki TaxID=330153 RepID=A0A7J6ME44_PERCH|nr:hypothetical protein FOL47_002340 [Perkinsus chesapeaki]